MEIKYSKQAVKYIASLDKEFQRRIRNGIKIVPQGDVVRLKGNENGYRLRIGKFRVIFRIENDIMYIDKIASRGQVYKNMKKWR